MDDDNRVQRELFLGDINLWNVRWYIAYPITYRQIAKKMEERGVRKVILRLTGKVRPAQQSNSMAA
jgi:transposase-like protein